MSDISDNLLASFEALPLQEQHELLTTMIRKSGELPDSLISDEGLTALADDLFQALDAEEADG
jgi:hypothetical protein